MNIEDKIDEVLFTGLEKLYGTNDEKIVLFLFHIRYEIYNIFNKDKNKIDFLLKELNLPETFKINNENVKKYGYENSLNLIIENWQFRYDMIGILNIESFLKKYKDLTIKKFKKYRKSEQYYNERFIYHMLTLLYEDFNLIISDLPYLKEIENNNYSNLVYTWDQTYYTYNKMYNIEHNVFTEKDLEDYIVNNRYFEDIKIISRQIKTEHGRIDLLGEKNNHKYGIELKIKSKPRDLIYQLNLYYKELFNIYKESNLIAITPPLKIEVLEQVSQIPLNLYFYEKNGQVINFKKII